MSTPPAKGRAQAMVRTGGGAKTSVTAAALVVAVLYTWKANGLSLGSMERPGSGLFPVVVGAFFVLMCCVALVEARIEGRRQAVGDSTGEGGVAEVVDRQPKAAPAAPREPAFDLRRLAAFLMILTLQVLAFVPLGFIVSTFLGLMAISTLLGERTRKRITRNAVFSAVLTMLLYVIFGMVLDISLPAGIYAPAVL